MIKKCVKFISSITALIAFTSIAAPQLTATNVLVNENFGSKAVKNINVSKSYNSLMNLMKGTAKIETQYDGTYISKIEGIGGDSDSAWMFYINGVSSLIGANDLVPKNSDDVIFDYHSWKTGFNFNSIVGSYPKPFACAATNLKNVVGYTPGCKKEAQLLIKFLKNAGVKNVTIMSADKITDKNLNIIVGTDSELLKNKFIKTKIADVNYGMYAKINPNNIRIPYDDNKTFKIFVKAGMVYSISLPKKDSKPTWIVSATDKKSLNSTVKLFSNINNFKGKFDIIYSNSKVYGIPLAK